MDWKEYLMNHMRKYQEYNITEILNDKTMDININGVTITLTESQVAEVVRASRKSTDIKDRVKTYEDAYNIVRPSWWTASDHVTNDDITDRSNAYSNLDLVSSARRAMSILAYSQLSVIADALNEGWEPDVNNRSQPKYAVSYISFNDKSNDHWGDGGFTYSVAADHSSLIYFKSEEIAKYCVRQFLPLWRHFFMVVEPD